MMKKVISILMLVAAMCSSIMIIPFTAQAQDVSVFGITLGKSLVSAGMVECKSYTDTNCYRVKKISSCFTEVKQRLSFWMTIYAILLDECDLQSPVQEVQGTFSSESYGKVLSLVTDKFGKPYKTEKSVTQNQMGATFDKIKSFWNVEQHRIYLTNICGKVTEGCLIVTHPDKILMDSEKSGEKSKSDRDKF